jgi:hypothetical protein
VEFIWMGDGECVFEVCDAVGAGLACLRICMARAEEQALWAADLHRLGETQAKLGALIEAPAVLFLPVQRHRDDAIDALESRSTTEPAAIVGTDRVGDILAATVLDIVQQGLGAAARDEKQEGGAGLDADTAPEMHLKRIALHEMIIGLRELAHTGKAEDAPAHRACMRTGSTGRGVDEIDNVGQKGLQHGRFLRLCTAKILWTNYK